MSLIGVNLAVFNLLPFPALDGSRVVFTLVEGVRKKPMNRRVEGIIHAVGLVLLLLFTVVVDLQHCF
jgi:regulator of sigma E protease